MDRKRRLKVLVATGAGILLTGEATFAFWTTRSTEAVLTSTGDTVAVIVSQAPPTVPLRPGKSVPLHGTISNPNTATVQFTGFTADVESVRTTHGKATRPCSPDDYFIDGGPQISTGTSEIPGLGQAAWEGMTLHMIRDDTSSQADCLGAVVKVAYTATP